MERNFSIIIADDDKDDQYIIQQALKETKLSHDLVFMSNGLELIDYLFGKGATKKQENTRPDLILMDLNMPLLDGYGVLEQVKSHTDFKDIPVYILSTSRFDYDKQKSLQLGAADFFSKPYQFEDLKVIIKDICVKTLVPLLQEPQK
jgi:two-component system response regulator